MNVIKEYRVQILTEWLSSIDYYQLRAIESLLPALFQDGRRVRGVMLTPDICIARDRKLYFIKDGLATPMSAEDVRVAGYTVAHLRQCLALARSSVQASRRQGGKDNATPDEGCHCCAK